MSYLRAVSRVASVQQLAVVHALRVAPSSLRAFHLCQQRQFSSTSRKQATSSPNLDAFSAKALNSPLFKELADKPEVLQSMKDLISVMQQEGASQISKRKEVWSAKLNSWSVRHFYRS